MCGGVGWVGCGVVWCVCVRKRERERALVNAVGLHYLLSIGSFILLRGRNPNYLCIQRTKK